MTTSRSAHPYVGSGFLAEWLREDGKFTTGGVCFRFVPTFTVTGLLHQVKISQRRSLVTPLGRVRFSEVEQLLSEPCSTWQAVGEVCGFANRSAKLGDKVELIITLSSQQRLVGHIKTMGSEYDGLAIHDVADDNTVSVRDIL